MDYTSLQSHQEPMTLPSAPHSHRQLLLSDILLLANLMGMKYLIIVLICSSLTTGQVEHFVIHLSAIQFFFCKL